MEVETEIYYCGYIDMERRNNHKGAYELLVNGNSEGFFSSFKSLKEYAKDNNIPIKNIGVEEL